MGQSQSQSTAAAVPGSPFFRPSDPRAMRPIATPGGTLRLRRKKQYEEPELKSNLMSASSNLAVSIVGAGIVGVPYAMQQSGLVAGLVLTIFCAFLTEKSLRLLIDTAKHVDVPSYETLYEASFGSAGFVAMSCFMFTMSYGAMVSYMMIIKETLAQLFGIAPDNLPLKRTILAMVTICVLFPLAGQRDMADLAKTSKISVCFYIMIVLFVAINSPISETAAEIGGWQKTITSSIIRPQTMFTGLGVLSFAFVCQHSAFIIAGSLHKPTRSRWTTVTRSSLLFCGSLAVLIGVTGYLGFMEATDGNVLINFENMATATPLVQKMAVLSRIMLVCCMLCVYPMDAFVARHVCVVLIFKGRQAHEGDDHNVLARNDRRIGLTIAILAFTVVPALLLEDLGSVLAVTGAIAGSFLSYIGPGTAYLAVHGGEFLKLIHKKWKWGGQWLTANHPSMMHLQDNVDNTNTNNNNNNNLELPISNANVENKDRCGEMTLTIAPTLLNATDNNNNNTTTTTTNNNNNTGTLVTAYSTAIIGSVVWYITFMPVWVGIAQIGKSQLQNHYEKEALKSPHPNRLGQVQHHNTPLHRVTPSKVLLLPAQRKIGMSIDDSVLGKKKNSNSNNNNIGYGSIQPLTGSASISVFLPKQQNQRGTTLQPATTNKGNSRDGDNDIDTANDEDMENDPQEEFPELYDFIAAIGFIMFGVVAMVVGVWSILFN